MIWGLVSANQKRLDLKESRKLAHHGSGSPVESDTFTVHGSEGEATHCDVAGRRLEYFGWRARGRYTITDSVELRLDGHPVLTATASRSPELLSARVMRSGLHGNVLDLPLTIKMPPRGILRRQRHIDISVGDEALRYMWGPSRPILVRGSNRGDLVMKATGADSYELLRPVREHEDLVAAALALGRARKAIRNPVLGFLEAIFDAI